MPVKDENLYVTSVVLDADTRAKLQRLVEHYRETLKLYNVNASAVIRLAIDKLYQEVFGDA